MAMFSLDDVNAESVNKKYSCEQVMIFQTWANFSRRGGKSHVRGNSHSSCPCTAMGLDVVIWTILVPQSICYVHITKEKG